jgi:hypothetical protein
MFFRSSIAPPTDTLSTLRAKPHGIARKTQGQDGVAFSFLVGLFHPLQHAGLSRRTPTKLCAWRVADIVFNNFVAEPGTKYSRLFDSKQQAPLNHLQKILIVVGRFHDTKQAVRT